MSDFKIIEVTNNDGSKAVSLKGDWSAEIVEALKSLDFSELNFVGFDLPDFLGFSSISKNISRLAISGVDGKSHGLENFTEIRSLLLDEPIKPAFDISCYKKLEEATLTWNKKYPADFFKLPRLRKLKLRHFDEVDCVVIGESSSIEELSVLESKIHKLDGLQNIRSLKKLIVAYARNLEDITALSGLGSLESLHIESCSKISDLSSIIKLKGLKKLHVEKVKASFDNLDWVGDLSDLSYVYNEAEVVDINWYNVFANKTIREFTTRTHEGYTITDDELVSIASQAGRMIKVIERYPPKKKPMITVEFDN